MSDNISSGTTEILPPQGSGGTAIPADTVALPRAQHEAYEAAAKALPKIIRIVVNPGDGGPYEAGELPELDEANAALAALRAAGIETVQP